MNNIKALTIAFVSILSLILWGGSALAQQSSSAFVPEYTETSSVGTHPMGWDTFEASWLIGHRVYSSLHGDFGQIEDLMIDSANGRIVLVVLSGVQGFGTKYVVAPYSALERTGENSYQLDFDDRYISISSSYGTDPYAEDLYWYRSLVALSTIPPTIDPLWADSVYRYYGKEPYWTEGRTVHPDIMSYRAARSSEGKTAPVLMGATVQSGDGAGEARINDLVIDSKDGRIAFLVLDNIPGRTEQVAVPFGKLSMTGDAFVLDTTREQLASAPSFNESTDIGNRENAASVFRFFGAQPYWTEEQMP